MIRKTDELEAKLRKLKTGEFVKYMEDHKEDFILNDKEFEIFMKEMMASKDIKLKDVFLRADISEKYGYKLLSGEKRTRQRDAILRICYAAEMSVDETQYALKLYGMPELFASVPRDAMLMIIFNDRPGNIIDVNSILMDNGMQVLRSIGVQD